MPKISINCEGPGHCEQCLNYSATRYKIVIGIIETTLCTFCKVTLQNVLEKESKKYEGY